MAKSLDVTPRFVVAKYAPDLDRMEPRNIGVFLWVKGKIGCRFLTEEAAATFVSEMDVYRRWVKYWTEAVSGESIEPRRAAPVPLSDPRSLDALLTTQKGNYILTNSGELLQSLRKKEIGQATTFLFRELVAIKGERPKSDTRSFASRCETVLDASGISARGDYKKKYEVDVNLYGVVRPIHFSYGFGNGHPEALLQRVQFTSEESVTSSLLKIHSLLNTTSIRAHALRVLYRQTDVTSEVAEKALAQFGNECEVVDIEAPDAPTRLRKLLLLGA